MRVPPEVLFYLKLLKIGMQSAKDIRKDDLIFQVWGSAAGPPTPPAFRVILYHTEASGQTLLGRSVCSYKKLTLSIRTFENESSIKKGSLHTASYFAIR